MLAHKHTFADESRDARVEYAMCAFVIFLVAIPEKQSNATRYGRQDDHLHKPNTLVAKPHSKRVD